MNKQKKSHRFLIAYDLLAPNVKEDDYSDLYDALEDMDAQRIQKSVWVVRTELNATQVFGQLQNHIHRYDRLLVTRIGDFMSRRGINKIKLI